MLLVSPTARIFLWLSICGFNSDISDFLTNLKSIHAYFEWKFAYFFNGIDSEKKWKTHLMYKWLYTYIFCRWSIAFELFGCWKVESKAPLALDIYPLGQKRWLYSSHDHLNNCIAKLLTLGWINFFLFSVLL